MPLRLRKRQLKKEADEVFTNRWAPQQALIKDVSADLMKFVELMKERDRERLIGSS